MVRFIQKVFYKPVLFFFLLPLFYILFGAIFALPYDEFSWLVFAMLYLFVINNQMLENMFNRIPTDNFKLSKKFIAILNLINLIIMIFFGWRYSWYASLLMVLYSLFIQTQFIFFYYDLEHVGSIIGSLFKIILLNGISFYSHAQFLHSRYLPFYLGIFLPFFIYEISGLEENPYKKWLPLLLSTSYVAGIITLWNTAAWWSLSLLLSFPFAWSAQKEFSRMASAVYAVVFALIYLVILLVHL